ncbi:MAG TPA: Crp/Fnr family transcriptional regulator [Anaerolineae bacterium]|nr:Crp/Fnr family transcriptional regulator [Anaerolineae bacterium]HOQ99999.1 Crp/Fnr family transcriptional regulator [Anaerolineae bacterium]HPL27205.1 Crp/Fnr family transcriptional regulator [Anaerolineae bacterium]
MNPGELVVRLARVRHFRGLSPSTLHAIVTAGSIRRYTAGSMIFIEGEPCAGMFVLLSGKVHLTRSCPQGRTMLLAEIEPVIMFNEVPLLDGDSNPASATAVRDCLTWHMGREAFEALLQRRPEAGMLQVALGLLKVLAARNRSLISRCTGLSFSSVLARTARLLVDLSDKGQHTIQRREHTIADMAARVDTAPAVISRSLSLLHAEGLIDCTRTEITVLDVQALATVDSAEPIMHID